MIFFSLLTTKAKRIHNVLLKHFYLSPHLNNFLLQAVHLFQESKKKEKATNECNNKAGQHLNPLGPLIKLVRLPIVRPDTHIYSRCLLQFISA